jgi:nucleotide-binding universal stress UspA family protein
MIGIARILVPVDFSDPSRKAIRYGISLAVEADAKLILAHVVPFYPPVPYAHPFEDRKMSESQAAEIRKKLNEEKGHELEGAVETDCVVRSGDVRDELLGLADEQDVDLIVMGTHGRRRFERWLLGSVTEAVVRRSTVPVLTVSHLDVDHALEEPKPIPVRKILCATDLSSGSVEAIVRSVEWSRELSAEMIILHVVPEVEWAYGAENVPLNLEVDQHALHEGALKRLRETIPESVQKDPRVRVEVRDGVPYEVILGTADSEEADMIVLTTSSRPGLDRALLGSTAERVLRAAHVPVLSFPPAGTESGAGKDRARSSSSGATLI